MENKYDVIIIGAGIGGLTSAAILAKNGKKVLVLEKNPMAGGYAINFRRKGFMFDASLHMINGCREGGLMYGILKRHGILSKIELIKPKYLYRSIYPDIDITVPQCNIPEYIDILTQYFPKESRGINNLFAEMQGLHHDAEQFTYSRVPFIIEQLYFPIKYKYLFQYSNKTFEFLLNKYLKDVRLKAVISQLWPYYGLPPSMLSSFYYTYPTFDYLYNGGYYIKGGSQSLTNALVEIIKENNGEILYKKNVNKLIIKNNTAKAVMTNKDEQFFANKFVSNIDARTTFLDLIGQENIPVKLIRNITSMQPSSSVFQVYLGLNKSAEEIGLSEYEVWYNPSYDINGQYEASLGMIDVNKTFFALAMYSNIDSSLALHGKSVMSIGILSSYDYWASLTRGNYLEEKQRVSEGLIKQAEKIIPNLSSYIEHMESATPLTMERYTSNYKGAVYGWSQVISQSGINRLKKEAPIKNLYLASAWTRIGGGIFPVTYAGESAARAILK